MRYNNNQEIAKGSETMSKLEEARLTINEVDEAMAQLFEKRMQAVEEVVKTADGSIQSLSEIGFIP